jgi:hypothetical protein
MFLVKLLEGCSLQEKTQDYKYALALKWIAMDVLMPFADLLSTYEERLNMHLKLLPVILFHRNQWQKKGLGGSLQCQQLRATSDS